MKFPDINHLDEDKFVRIFGNIVENYPDVSKKLFTKKPFKDIEDIFTKAENIIDAFNDIEKEKILKLHPDLAGKLADEGKLTSESTEEQKAAGLDKISNENKTQMNSLNKRYKTKFGFPFVICARENKVESILKGLDERTNNEKHDELQIGINEVKKISKLRVQSIIEN